MKVVYTILAAFLFICLAVFISYNFHKPSSTTKSIQLYYYNPTLDIDGAGNILCSDKGLVPVNRELSVNYSVEDLVNLLLQGDLPTEERSAGISTEFPLSGLVLDGSTLSDGLLTLNFSDPNNRTSGGSCRASILWAQIERTAKQYPGVSKVRFSPNSIFQP